MFFIYIIRCPMDVAIPLTANIFHLPSSRWRRIKIQKTDWAENGHDHKFLVTRIRFFIARTMAIILCEEKNAHSWLALMQSSKLKDYGVWCDWREALRNCCFRSLFCLSLCCSACTCFNLQWLLPTNRISTRFIALKWRRNSPNKLAKTLFVETFVQRKHTPFRPTC